MPTHTAVELMAEDCFLAETGKDTKWAAGLLKGAADTGKDLFSLSDGLVGRLLGFALIVVLFAAVAIAIPFALAGNLAYNRWHVSRRLAAFRDGEPDALHAAYKFAIQRFRAELADHRERTMGDGSEWGVAHRSISADLDKTRKSVGYWSRRRREEPDNQMAAGQMKRARTLEDKLATALAKLDSRAAVLLKFYGQCEARLKVMEGYARDLREMRRLQDLVDSAEAHLAENVSSLSFGDGFVAEAQAVSEALSGFAEVQVKALAGEAPLDDIEHLADRIIETSDAEREAIETLCKAV